METVISIPRQILVQAILILLNAFFASAEIAVISLNHNKLKKQAEEGDKKSNILLKMVENPSNFLSTIQIGITLAGFLGSALAADTLAEELTKVFISWGATIPYNTLNTISVFIITIIISFFTLIFGELVPKRIAQQKAEGVARFCCSVLNVLAKIMRPVIWLLSFCTNSVLRIFRFKANAEEETATEEDIRLMVDASGESGSIEEDEKEWIQNVFELNDTLVSEIMTRVSDIWAVQIGMTNAEILSLIKESGRSRFPVYDEDLNDIKGILNVRDFLLSLTDDNVKKVSDLMRPAYFVPDTIRADKLFSDMQGKKQHIAICVDEYGQTSGLISLEDLLEEVVGNIYDEFDEQEEEELVKLGDNLWKVSGTLPVEDLEEALDMDLPNEELDFDTVGGMVFSCLNEIPKDGSEIEVEVFGLKIHVTKIEDKRIVEALVSKLEPEEVKEKEEDGRKDREKEKKED